MVQRKYHLPIDVTDAGYTLEPAPQRHLDFGAGGHTRRQGYIIYTVCPGSSDPPEKMFLYI